MKKEPVKKNASLLLILQLILLIGVQAAVAQFQIKIPKLPKPKTQPTPANTVPPSDSTQPSTASRPAAKGATTIDVDAPTIAKDSIQIRAFTFNVYKKNYDIWSWVPEMKFSVNGPVASGSRLEVEFSIPGSGSWLKLDCKAESIGAGATMKTECGGRQIPEDKGSTHTGAVDFSIRLVNELAGDATNLFAGKMKVAKVRSNATAPNTANHFVYYVDHDWNLPIAYLFYEGDYAYEEGRPERWAKPKFSIAFWTRGEINGSARPHLFFGGKEIGKAFYNGREVSVPDCSVDEVRNAPTHITSPEGQFIWTRRKCTFNNVIPWNKTRDSNETMFGRLHLFSENPGEYELKIMHNGRLIRTLKFAVDREGKLVDNGIAKGNKLGSDRIIVPVQILGDQDGPWDRTAWRSDAFYGNPLVGFGSSN